MYNLFCKRGAGGGVLDSRYVLYHDGRSRMAIDGGGQEWGFPLFLSTSLRKLWNHWGAVFLVPPFLVDMVGCCAEDLVGTYLVGFCGLLPIYKGPHDGVFKFLDPFRSKVPFWRRTTQISFSLSPKRDCGPRKVNLIQK